MTEEKVELTDGDPSDLSPNGSELRGSLEDGPQHVTPSSVPGN